MRPWYKNLDWFTLLIWIALVCVGLTAIYSATHGPAREFLKDSVQQNFSRQLEWFAVSAGVMLVVLLLPARFIVRMAPLAYLFCIGVLVAAILFGREINGAKAWVWGLQPGEIGKVGTVLAVTALLATKEARQGNPMRLVGAAVLLLVPVGLLLAANDTGTALVYLALVPVMLFWSGVVPLPIMALMAAPFGGRLPRHRRSRARGALRTRRHGRVLRVDPLEGDGRADVRRHGGRGHCGAPDVVPGAPAAPDQPNRGLQQTPSRSATARASTSSRPRRPSARAGCSARASPTARRRSSRTSPRTRPTSSSASSARSSASSGRRLCWCSSGSC